MAAAKINSPTSSPSPVKLSRRFTTVISYDLRDSEFRPVEKNRVELGPSNKLYETCEVQKDLARKFGVTQDSVRVGRFRRALNRENLMYAVVCGCRHGHTTRHVFVHDYQKASTDYPVCICVDANISVRGLLCCLDSQHDQYCLFMNGRMLDLEIHQVSDWQPVTFLQMIRRQNVKILLSWHREPGVKIVFYLSVQNTDSVDEIRHKLLGRHAESLKCEGKEISFSEGSTILSNRCVPKILALTSDGEVLPKVCKMPLSVHVHTAESVPVHVRFCDDAFIIFVPRGTSFRSLKSEIAKVLDEPPWSLEYSANSELLAPDDFVGHPSENGQSCTVELVRGVVADVKIHIDFANVTGLDFVHVQIYRQESLDALRISLAKKLSVHPNCVWFHDMENAIPPADSPVAEFLQPAGEVMQLTLTAREHPRCTVLQVCCKKFRTVDSLWVDNSEQRTCGQLLQYLQQSMGTRAQRRVVAFCGAQRIAENCTLSLAAADLDRLPRLTVHLSSKCLPPWELPPPYQQRFVGGFSGGFEREYFLNINGVPHFTKRVPTPSSQPQTEEITSGFTLLTTHFLNKVSAQPLTVATSKVDATVGFEPCNPGDPSGNMSVAAGRKFCRSISETEGRNVGIIRPSVPHQNWPNSQDIVYPTPTHARQHFTNGGQHRQVAPVRPNLRSYPDDLASLDNGGTPGSVMEGMQSEAAPPSLTSSADPHLTPPSDPHHPPTSLPEVPALVPTSHCTTVAARPAMEMMRYNPASADRKEGTSTSFPAVPGSQETEDYAASHRGACGQLGASCILIKTVTSTCQQTEVMLPNQMPVSQELQQAVAQIVRTQSGGLPQPQHASVVTPILKKNDALDAAIGHVANKIENNDWCKLSFSLGLTPKDLDDLMHEHPGNMFSQIRKGLQKWRQAEGSGATVQTLKSKLIANQLMSLAEELRDDDVS